MLAAVLTCAALLHADTLTGTVKNATTGKPAAGDDVVLLNLSQGMNEGARTKTDAQGRFTFDIKDSGTPHLVRVNHQGVNYFPAGGPIRPGATTTEIQVYDVAKKVDGIAENVRVMRLQADSTTLQAIDLISVKNSSNPPRALMADRTYEFYLPEGAQIDESVAQSPGGMPVNTAPVPDDKVKGKYYFVFPLRPGETRFQVAYHLPYSGEATLSPKVTGRLEHFAVLIPKSMQFAAKVEGTYSPMADEGTQSTLQVATGVVPGKDLSFRVAGAGTIAEAQEGGSGSGGGGRDTQAAQGGQRGPGGGLGTPEGTPDPLHKYRWPILGGCVAILAIGGFWVVSRQQPGSAAKPSASPEPSPAAIAGGSQGSLLLHALKEELFQLEVDRQKGSISEEEYTKAKAALDQTLQRAIARTQATKA